MKIAVMGSGGVGGYFGARLAQSGCEVSFIARGAHLAAMKEHGLKIESRLGDIHLPSVRVTDDPRTLDPVDLVLFSVKLWDTEAAARSLAPLVGPDTGIVSFQNGVQKDDILKRLCGEKAVMGGVGYIATAIARPGVIRHTGTMQRLLFGEYDGRRSARAEAFLAACRRAGIDAELSADIRREVWEKFVFLVGLSGTTATMRLPIGPIRENPRTRAFLFDLMQEAVAVGRAHGVALAEDYAEKRLAFCDGLPPDMTSSLHHDLERGNPLEVEWLSGGVVHLGQQVGVPTPANRAVWDILALHAAGRMRG
ncbi:MAG: 2-dehydropantoate 2-reductase [Betaproteobacteria bacterium]|nr:2-dehydropantoate 2-reductase [Betaproteobacteria bacterium]